MVVTVGTITHWSTLFIEPVSDWVALWLRKWVKLYPLHLGFVQLSAVTGTTAPCTMLCRQYCPISPSAALYDVPPRDFRVQRHLANSQSGVSLFIG